MEITIRVEKVLDVQSFSSRNKYSFVGKTDDQYPKSIFFTCWDDDNWKKFNIKVGGTYQVSFDVSSREWNGRWYTDVNVWRVIAIGSTPQPERKQRAPKPTTTPNATKVEEQPQTQSSSDELPF